MCAMSRDGRKPSRQRLDIAQLWQTFMDLNPHLLKHIGDDFAWRTNAVGHRVNETLVPHHEFLPCRLVSLDAPLDQLTINTWLFH
jgi:hypothetical protein